MNPAVLIAYFSGLRNNYVTGSIVALPVGSTELIAGKLRELAGGTVFRIRPAKTYSKDYHTCTEETK